MNKFKLTLLSLCLTLGVSLSFAQNYGNNSRNSGRRGNSTAQPMHGGGHGNGYSQGGGYAAPARVRTGGGVGYNAGATCGTRGGGYNTVSRTDNYYRGNSRGTVRTTTFHSLPQTCFNGNRRTRYIYSDCGTFYHQIVERRHQTPGRWVYVGCDRYWEPGFTTWVQVSSCPMYW